MQGHLSRRHAGGYGTHQRIRIRVEKKSDGVALAFRWQHAVRRGHINLVGPAHQAVADIADKGTRDGGYVDPCAVTRAYLQSRDAISREQGDVAVVGVGAGTRLSVWRICVAGERVVQKAQGGHGRAQLVIEKGLGEAQVERERAVQALAHGQHGIEVGLRTRTPARDRWPDVGGPGGAVGPDQVVGLLQIRQGLLVQRFHAQADITAVVAMRANGEIALGVRRQCEHVMGGRESAVDIGLRDAMPGDGEKADAAAGDADLLRHPLATPGITPNQAGDIDKWKWVHGAM